MSQPIRSIVTGVAEIRQGDPHLAPAVKLAEALGAVLHVVHAFSSPDAVLGKLDPIEVHAPDGRQPLEREVLALLEAQVGSTAANTTIVCHAMAGSPGEAILHVADREGVDLVIVGGTRRGTVASTVLGTTAQRVLRASRAPVLVNRRPGHGAPRRVLLTTDLSDLSAMVHERGLELVGMLWGWRGVETRSLLVGGDDVLLPPPVQQIAMRQHAEARLDAFLQNARVEGRGVEGKVRLGPSAKEILAEAEEWDADLLILGTQGRTAISRFLIGSVAERVSRKASCDVLMIPAAALGSAGRIRVLSGT